MNSYSCQCPLGFRSAHCEQGKSTKQVGNVLPSFQRLMSASQFHVNMVDYVTIAWDIMIAHVQQDLLVMTVKQVRNMTFC